MNKVTLEEMSPIIIEVLNSGGEVSFITKGISMRPMLDNNKDKIVLVKPSFPLKKYDIPLFTRKDGSYVLHRIIAVKKDGYVLCGDNQTIKEYNVKDDQIVGVVKGFHKGNKYIDCTDLSYRLYCILFLPIWRMKNKFGRYPLRICRKIIRILKKK